jgi:hypothetical protein
MKYYSERLFDIKTRRTIPPLKSKEDNSSFKRQGGMT